MKRTGMIGLLALAVLALTGWTTNKSSGTAQKTFAFASTGKVVPDSTSTAGRTYMSIADLAGTGTATILVYGRDFPGGSTLVTLGAGAAWETNAPQGIDSARVVTNATILGFHLSN